MGARKTAGPGRHSLLHREWTQPRQVSSNLLSIFIGNDTTVSPKAAGFVEQNEDTFDVVCVMEHHIKNASSFQVLQMFGWKLVTAPARATSEEHRGTKGGTFVAVRKHLQPVGVW